MKKMGKYIDFAHKAINTKLIANACLSTEN